MEPDVMEGIEVDNEVQQGTNEDRNARDTKGENNGSEPSTTTSYMRVLIGMEEKE